jgi:hypothetical protein
MSQLQRTILWVVAAAVGVSLLAYAFVSGNNCVGYQLAELPSPTKTFLATVKNNTCTESRQLQTVVEVTGAPGVTGWVFAAPLTAPNADLHSAAPVTVAWLSGTELQVAYPHGTDVQSRRESIGSVKVVYKELDRKP